ncbi:MAG: hypothetical protein ACE5G0_15945, partial [Rhodothermales bacterium]
VIASVSLPGGSNFGAHYHCHELLIGESIIFFYNALYMQVKLANHVGIVSCRRARHHMMAQSTITHLGKLQMPGHNDL